MIRIYNKNDFESAKDDEELKDAKCYQLNSVATARGVKKKITRHIVLKLKESIIENKRDKVTIGVVEDEIITISTISTDYVFCWSYHPSISRNFQRDTFIYVYDATRFEVKDLEPLPDKVGGFSVYSSKIIEVEKSGENLVEEDKAVETEQAPVLAKMKPFLSYKYEGYEVRLIKVDVDRSYLLTKVVPRLNLFKENVVNYMKVQFDVLSSEAYLRYSEGLISLYSPAKAIAVYKSKKRKVEKMNIDDERKKTRLQEINDIMSEIMSKKEPVKKSLKGMYYWLIPSIVADYSDLVVYSNSTVGDSAWICTLFSDKYCSLSREAKIQFVLKEPGPFQVLLTTQDSALKFSPASYELKNLKFMPVKITRMPRNLARLFEVIMPDFQITKWAKISYPLELNHSRATRTKGKHVTLKHNPSNKSLVLGYEDYEGTQVFTLNGEKMTTSSFENLLDFFVSKKIVKSKVATKVSVNEIELGGNPVPFYRLCENLNLFSYSPQQVKEKTNILFSSLEFLHQRLKKTLRLHMTVNEPLVLSVPSSEDIKLIMDEVAIRPIYIKSVFFINQFPEPKGKSSEILVNWNLLDNIYTCFVYKSGETSFRVPYLQHMEKSPLIYNSLWLCGYTDQVHRYQPLTPGGSGDGIQCERFFSCPVREVQQMPLFFVHERGIMSSTLLNLACRAKFKIKFQQTAYGLDSTNEFGSLYTKSIEECVCRGLVFLPDDEEYVMLKIMSTYWSSLLCFDSCTPVGSTVAGKKLHIGDKYEDNNFFIGCECPSVRTIDVTRWVETNPDLAKLKLTDSSLKDAIINLLEFKRDEVEYGNGNTGYMHASNFFLNFEIRTAFLAQTFTSFYKINRTYQQSSGFLRHYNLPQVSMLDAMLLLSERVAIGCAYSLSMRAEIFSVIISIKLRRLAEVK